MTALIGLGIFIVSNASQLVGFILPPLVDYLNKDVTNDSERFIVTLLVCIGVTLLIKFPDLAVGSSDGVASSLGIVFIESQVIYKLYFKDSYLRVKLQEKLTSNEV